GWGAVAGRLADATAAGAAAPDGCDHQSAGVELEAGLQVGHGADGPERADWHLGQRWSAMKFGPRFASEIASVHNNRPAPCCQGGVPEKSTAAARQPSFRR